VAIKPPEILNRLPSVSELLEKPPIRALANRWNRSVVAGNVRSFLEELKNDIRRRAADVQLPSVRELAERAAHYIVSRQKQSLGAAINATGDLWGAPWSGRPLSDAALERAMAAGREFIEARSFQDKSAATYEDQLCHLTGAQAAVAVHSYSGAVWLALTTLAAGREVLVARGEIGDIDVAEPLPKLAELAEARLNEVGTTNRAAASDYELAILENTAAILTISPDEYRVVGQTATAEFDELVALVRERELTLVSAVGTAPLLESPSTIHWPQRSVRSMIAAGANLVIVRGDGLVGGPACGLLVGNRDIIERISKHPLFASWRLDAMRTAALAATLESQEAVEGSVEALPVWQLLTTPVENLRNRAERLAPQLAQAPGIASAIAVETRSPISAVLSESGGYASYGIALTAADGNGTALDERLQRLSVPIYGRRENERLVLDLRTVLPRQDRSLVESIVGAANVEEGSPQSGEQPSNSPN
jgi:L-seryl-tRNA(Ser) seleniumtransferase